MSRTPELVEPVYVSAEEVVFEDSLKAIKDDGLIWPYVSDLNYWDNEISRYFGINSIPATILIDPEGKIVAKKLHGDELEEKLIEIFEN